MWPWKKKKKHKVEPGKDNIPFSLSKGVPIIKCTINGKGARLLIDTGASLNILSKELSKDYGYNVYSINRNDNTVRGIGGIRTMLGVSKAKIRIEDKEMYIPFQSISMKQLFKKLGIVGIIGSRWLSKNDYIIDYTNNTLHKVDIKHNQV